MDARQTLAQDERKTTLTMSDDDIAEMLDTIANEKDVKMAEYKLPDEPDVPRDLCPDCAQRKES